jgi:hypothetical protein
MRTKKGLRPPSNPRKLKKRIESKVRVHKLSSDEINMYKMIAITSWNKKITMTLGKSLIKTSRNKNKIKND